MSDFSGPHGHPPLPWNFLGKNTGVGCHFLLQVIFLLGIKSAPPALAGKFFSTESPGKLDIDVEIDK